MVASLGEVDFTIDSRRAGQFRVIAISAWPSLGSMLRVTLGCRLMDLPEGTEYHPASAIRGYQLVDLTGEVTLGENGPVAGLLARVGPRSLVTSTHYGHEDHVPLAWQLDGMRLERLEEFRRGGPLRVWFSLAPLIQHEGHPLRVYVNRFPAHVPVELWADVLRQLRRDEYEILEVRFSLANAQRFRASLSQLQTARELVDRGDYANAIVRCRKAVELLAVDTRADNQDAPSVRSILEAVVGPSRAEVYAGLMSNVKRLGNLELHDTAGHGFSRAEALFTIRVAESVLELWGSLLTDGA